MNTIKQMRVSNSISFFKPGLLKKYGFSDYGKKGEPAFFYGIYTGADLAALKAHKGIKVIIWSGTDIHYRFNKNVAKFVAEIKKLADVYHIANSQFIINDLTYFTIPYKFFPVCGLSGTEYGPVEKGRCVYIYTSLTRPGLYGKTIYDEVIKRLPEFRFIVAVNPKNLAAYKGPLLNQNVVAVEPDKMLSVYKQCFIGLRLTGHDGIAYTVLELGLCGIRCIHNGNQPNAIKWTGPCAKPGKANAKVVTMKQCVDDIVSTIVDESVLMGTKGLDVNKKMVSYLNMSEDWKKVEGYLGVKPVSKA